MARLWLLFFLILVLIRMNVDKKMYKDELVRIGQALRSAREDAGMSIHDAAVRVGVDASTISKIERGAMNLSVVYLIAVARVYGLELWLER